VVVGGKGPFFAFSATNLTQEGRSVKGNSCTEGEMVRHPDSKWEEEEMGWEG